MPHAQALGEIGQRFIDRLRPSLEAQLANFADEIAYINHDVDDGLRSGLLSVAQLGEVELFARHHQDVLLMHPTASERRQIHETVRRMIGELVRDLIACTQSRITEYAPASIDAVRAAPPLVAFSDPVASQARQLKQFLFQNLYRHYRVLRMTSKAARLIVELFEAFVADPRLLPDEYRLRTESERHRAVADYLAGMTDRYVIKEHRRLFAVEVAD